MFGFELIKHKRALKQDFYECFSSLKDDLGNIPLEMKVNAYLNGAILSVCESYLEGQNVFKQSSKAVILDAVFEELYRRDSIPVQTQIDEWIKQKNESFMKGYNNAPQHSDYNLNIKWLEGYIQQNFKRATGLML
jgi:hypothetical protein|tara:strand:- start:134 stop:538 length:405 start_codon:yes stop_codon:yes gene_type:complete